MGNLFKLLLFGAGIYLAIQWHGGGAFEASVADKLAPGNEIVMYSLTTCGYCTQKRKQMTSAGIPFREVFLDTDQAKMQEFRELLAKHNVPPGGVGTPSLVVNGQLLLNNPGLPEIKRHLQFRS